VSTFYEGDFGAQLSVDIYEPDGFTPKLPLSATITVLNNSTTVLPSTSASVASGSAYYIIPSGSPITAEPAHLAVFFTVLVESGNQQTIPVYADVLPLDGSPVARAWQRKVAESAAHEDLVTDSMARQWVDDAVAFLSRRYGLTTHTSLLGTLTPAPSANEIEFYASVASLMARTSWWAGRGGSWRDEEISYNPNTIYAQEWARLDAYMESLNASAMLDGGVFNRFNADRVEGDARVADDHAYWYRPTT